MGEKTHGLSCASVAAAYRGNSAWLASFTHSGGLGFRPN